MMKEYFLKLRMNSDISQPKNYLSYKKTTQIGILYNSQDFSLENIYRFQNTLKADGKRIHILEYFHNSPSIIQSFSSKHLSMFGEIKTDSLKHFTKQHFHFLLSLCFNYDVHYNYILSKCSANYKVGIDIKPYRKYLHMSIASKNKKNVMKDVITYIKKI